MDTVVPLRTANLISGHSSYAARIFIPEGWTHKRGTTVCLTCKHIGVVVQCKKKTDDNSRLIIVLQLFV